MSRLIVDADRLAALIVAATAKPDPAITAAITALLGNGVVPPPDPWCSVDEAARKLGVSTRTVRRQVARGAIAHRRVGRRVLIARTAVDGQQATTQDPR